MEYFIDIETWKIKKLNCFQALKKLNLSINLNIINLFNNQLFQIIKQFSIYFGFYNKIKIISNIFIKIKYIWNIFIWENKLYFIINLVIIYILWINIRIINLLIIIHFYIII